MPPGLVKYQQSMPAWRHGLTDCFQVKRHGLGICKRQYQTHRRIALWAYGSKDIGRLKLLLPHDTGPCSLACPKTSLGATLTDAHFVLKPDIDLLDVDIRWENGLHFPGEVFF